MPPAVSASSGIPLPPRGTMGIPPLRQRLPCGWAGRAGGRPTAPRRASMWWGASSGTFVRGPSCRQLTRSAGIPPQERVPP
eukprot:7258691-Alexandrium_andersonii.AAC.1